MKPQRHPRSKPDRDAPQHNAGRPIKATQSAALGAHMDAISLALRAFRREF